MLKSKVSWAFILAVLFTIMTYRSWSGLLVGLLFAGGLFLLYNNKKQSKACLVAGALLMIYNHVRMLPLGDLVRSFLGGYIINLIESDIAWAVIFILGAIVSLALGYGILCVRILSGDVTRNRFLWGAQSAVFLFCMIFNFMMAVVANGYFYSLNYAIQQIFCFALLIFINRDLNPQKQKRTHTLLIAVIIAVILNIGIGAFSGAFVGGGGSSNSNKPWKELGVSEKEYMEIYNFYKYGVNFK